MEQELMKLFEEVDTILKKSGINLDLNLYDNSYTNIVNVMKSINENKEIVKLTEYGKRLMIEVQKKYAILILEYQDRLADDKLIRMVNEHSNLNKNNRNKSYKLSNGNEYANSKTRGIDSSYLKKIVAIIAGAAIIVGVGTSIAESRMERHYLDSEPQVSMNQENEEYHEYVPFDSYSFFEYEIELGDINKEVIAEKLDMDANDLMISDSMADIKPGDIVKINYKFTQENRQKVVNYEESTKSVGTNYVTEYELYSGEDIINLSNDILNNDPFLNEVYQEKSNDLANDLVAQNPNLARDRSNYNSGVYKFDLDKTDKKVTKELMEKYNTIVSKAHK